MRGRERLGQTSAWTATRCRRGSDVGVRQQVVSTDDHVNRFMNTLGTFPVGGP
jgi:hypothetical protein